MTIFFKFYDLGLNMYISPLHCYSRIDPRFSPNTLIEKHIERHQLVRVLSIWLGKETEGELRRKATQAIVAFYDKETNLITANQPKELDLSKCGLKSLPNLFSSPPFTGLVKLDLSCNRLEELPLMNKLENLQYLNLNQNHFEYLPSTLFACRNIEHLDLSYNKLLEIPLQIGELKKLTLLNINSNQLDLLPASINELRSLEIFYLDNNDIEELPDVSRLQKCREISIAQNQFSTFPSTLCSLSNLEMINFSSNNLSELPHTFKNLKKLDQLDLSNNSLKELPTCIPHLTNLEELLLDHNELKDLPNLHFLQNLTVLSIGSNSLNPLSPNIILPPLTHLFISSNDLKELPVFVTNCLSLTRLALDDNEFETLPDRIGNLTHLESLSLNINKLHSLPASFTTLKELQELELEGNSFTEFPKEILELSRLEKLNLDGNEIAEIPLLLPKLENLEEMNISENRLRNLPDCLEDLPSSLSISVDGNLFTPEEVQRIQTIVNNPHYRGPIIQGLGIQEEEEENLPGENITEICKLLFEFSEQTPRKFVNLPSDSLVLFSWLQRLGGVAEFKRAINKKIVATKILDILETANQNPLFREIFFKVIDNATQTCGDGVALSIIHLDIRQQLETIDLTKIHETSSFLLRGIFAIDLLGKHALKKIKEKKATDDIETYLAYPIQLKKDLNLPFSQADMRYLDCSQVTKEDLQEAKEIVLSHLQNPEECNSFLINNEVWQKVLALNYPKEWQKIENNKKIALEDDEPDYMRIRNTFEEEIKKLTHTVLYHPETIEEQCLEDPLDILMNCLEKGKYNAPLGVKQLIDIREDLLTKIFSNSKTNEHMLCKLDALMATLYFFYQKNDIKNLELLPFLLPMTSSKNTVPSISSCIKEILSRNSGRLYVELIHKLCKEQEIRNKIFEYFSIKEKNFLNPYAKSVNLFTRLTQLTNASLQGFRDQSVDMQSIVTSSLFFLLQNIKELDEFQDSASSSKKIRLTPQKDLEFLLLRFEKLTTNLEPTIVLLPKQEITLQSDDIIKLIINYKKYWLMEEYMYQSNAPAKEEELCLALTSLNEKFTNLCAQKAQEVQKHSINPMSLVAATWLSGASRSVPSASTTLPLPPNTPSRTTIPFSSATTSFSTISSRHADTSASSTNLTEAALSRLPSAPDTPLRESERIKSTQETPTRIAMMDPIYYKKV